MNEFGSEGIADGSANDNAINRRETEQQNEVIDLTRDYLDAIANPTGFFFIELENKYRQKIRENKKDEIHNAETVLVISIKASDIPEGQEGNVARQLKAFIEMASIDYKKKASISGTKEELDELRKLGCSNAFASGVRPVVVE